MLSLVAQGTDPAALLREGKFREALGEAEGQLKEHPKDVRLLTVAGIAFTQLGNEAEALRRYRQALAIAPNYLPALEGATQIEYKRNDAEASEHLARLIKLNPSDQTAHAMRGVLEARAGRCGEATDDFREAPVEVEKQRDALRQYGTCQFRLKHWTEAEKTFGLLLVEDASDKRAAYGLAASQIEAGEFEAALAALKPFGDDGEALALSAQALEALGRTPEAIATLRSAIIADPKREALYAQFAQLCFTYKSYQAGIDLIDVGLAQLPNSAKLYLARGVLRAQQGNYDAADSDFQKAAELDPKEARSADAEVLALIEANRFTEASAAIAEKLKQHPRDAQLFYFKADVLNRQGNNEGSLKAAERAVLLRPDFVMAHDLLARLYAQNGGEQEKAIDECKAALRTDPEDETALYRWLRILQARHQDHDASAIAELAKRWQVAREKGKSDELRQSRFRIATSQ